MNRMQAFRLAKKQNMRQTARELGIPYTTYVSYEKGDRQPNTEMLLRLASYFGVSVDALLGNTHCAETAEPTESPCRSNPNRVPLLGIIACGEPILAEKNDSSLTTVPDGVRADFALRCKGESMINARIHDGDIVYIRSQPMVDDGEIAAVLIGEEATLKRVYRHAGRLELRAANPSFPNLFFNEKDTDQIRILGKAVAFTSRIP